MEGQLARWLEELSQFDMTIQHRAGCKHSNADGLSRIPEEDYCNCYEAGVHLADLPVEVVNFVPGFMKTGNALKVMSMMLCLLLSEQFTLQMMLMCSQHHPQQM